MCAAATPVEDMPYDTSPDSGVHDSMSTLSPEEQEKQRAEWTAELTKTEEEIQTLRQVLASKVKHAQDLKTKLGITVWKEFTDDMSQGMKNVRESTAYQKTESALKTTAEKTTSLFGGIGAKLTQVKETQAFKSLEEKVGSAYSNVKTKVSGSRSNSTQSFDEALKEAEAAKKSSDGTPATTPAIPEDKPLQ